MSSSSSSLPFASSSFSNPTPHSTYSELQLDLKPSHSYISVFVHPSDSLHSLYDGAQPTSNNSPQPTTITTTTTINIANIAKRARGRSYTFYGAQSRLLLLLFLLLLPFAQLGFSQAALRIRMERSDGFGCYGYTVVGMMRW